jgi:hypothetical protein
MNSQGGRAKLWLSNRVRLRPVNIESRGTAASIPKYNLL